MPRQGRRHDHNRNLSYFTQSPALLDFLALPLYFFRSPETTHCIT